MRNRIVQRVFLAAALCAASTLPAAAQNSNLSVGLGLWNNNLGVGVVGDYYKQTRTMSSMGGWGPVIDLGLSHKSESVLGISDSLTTFQASAGVRYVSKVNDKVSWHGQATAGVWHANVNVDLGLNQQVCDAFGIDCSAGASTTNFVFMPGAAVRYKLNDTSAFKIQANIPISSWEHALRLDLSYQWGK